MFTDTCEITEQRTSTESLPDVVRIFSPLFSFERQHTLSKNFPSYSIIYTCITSDQRGVGWKCNLPEISGPIPGIAIVGSKKSGESARHTARFRVAGARYRFTHRCSSLTRLKAGACSLPASTLGEQRKREKEEAYRCFDWSMLPAKTTQPITVTVPRNCRVSRFTKTGEGYPFEIPSR